MLKFKVLLDKRQIISYFNSAYLYRITIIIDFSILSSFIYHMERSINKSLSGPVYLQEKKIIKEKEVVYKITCLTLIISELPYPVCSCKESKQYSSRFLINAPFFFITIFVCCLSSHIFLGQESWPGDAVIAVTSINLGSKKEHTRSRSKEIWTHWRGSAQLSFGLLCRGDYTQPKI